MFESFTVGIGQSNKIGCEVPDSCLDDIFISCGQRINLTRNPNATSCLACGTKLRELDPIVDVLLKHGLTISGEQCTADDVDLWLRWLKWPQSGAPWCTLDRDDLARWRAVEKMMASEFHVIFGDDATDLFRNAWKALVAQEARKKWQ
jgi:hypothetical protein